MILDDLLGDVSRDTFLQEHFLRLPFSSPRGAAAFRPLATWETIAALAGDASADVMIVRRGERWTGTMPVAPETARMLFAEGYTLLARHAERNNAGLAELAAQFQHQFTAPVDVHLYATPANAHGFGWHYDAEDVFILQAEGSKEYSLRKNTVNPWPLVETLPRDMRYEREIMPLMKCRLDAGDWLYIPSGYWHRAEALSDSISIAVGVLSPARLDAVDFARREMLESIVWRQRLPVVSVESAIDESVVEQYRSVFAEIGIELAKMFADEGFARAYLEARGGGTGASMGQGERGA